MRILVISLSKISKAFLKMQQGVQIDVYSPNSTIEGLNCVNDFANLNGIYTHIFLGCKPQHVEDVAQNLPLNLYSSQTVFISVLAGTKVEKIKKLFHTEKVFRVMPSLAFEFGNSFLAYYIKGISDEEAETIKNLFGNNFLLKCENEEEVDYFTGIYGSGIGFVFEIMNAFFVKSQELFPNESNGSENNREIVLNLFQNACKYMENNPDLSFSNASQNVASKGGTTEAGLNFLRNQNLLQSVISGAIDEAITKAEGCNQ
jgi:pyrroline-5-carboxylate reductase